MGEENNFYLAPWVKEYKEKEKARRTWLLQLVEKYALSVEDSKHPNGHYMNEVVVTPLGTSLGTVSSNAMLDNLISTSKERKAKDRRDAFNMSWNMHKGTDAAARALFPLVMAPALFALPNAVVASGITKSLAPGSAFWMNPATKLFAASMLGGTTMDAASNILTGNTVGGNVRNMIGYQPKNEWEKFGYNMITDMANYGYLSPYGLIEKGVNQGINATIKNIGKVKSLLNSHPIPSYDYNSIIKSDFYKNLVLEFGENEAQQIVKDISTPEFRQFFIGNNPKTALKAGKKHEIQMGIVKDVENAGGTLSGSGLLARHGTVSREGLLHDLDFNIPGSVKNETSPIFEKLNFKPHLYRRKPSWATGTIPLDTKEFLAQEGYINIPMRKEGIISDMFVRDKMPSKDEIVDVILDAKRKWGRPKDLKDISIFKLYSSENPMLDITTGRGQWNPTLFERIFTEDKYPFVQAIETYPGSGIYRPAVMNTQGKIKTVGRVPIKFFERPLSRISLAERMGIPKGERNLPFKAKVPKITVDNAASITPEQWTAAQDAAIARGDMVEAQRLRDLHFKVSAPNTKVKEAVFNGSLSDKPFYEFNTNFRDAYWGGRDDYTTGAWFGTGDKNTLLSFAGDNPNRLKKFYLNFSNPFIKDAGYRRWNKLLPFNMTEEDIAIEAAKLREKGFPEYVIEDWKKGLKTTTDNYALKLETTDYDSGIIKNVYENKAYPDSEYGVITDYIASKPNQIKLADAVTYDDNGVRIPLGKRDSKLNDIRYSWLLPFLAVGAASYKQGGKMNILQFLKNGSGIHIKKENRGKFTDYCGGKVTSECIAKGKRSSNPAIRKRATFAANARKWKHEDGGRVKKHQTFVKGVSILDSNPDAYKYVKKKLHKAADGGTTLNWMLEASNWYNNNSLMINSIGSIVSSGISGIMGLKALNAQIEANDKKNNVTEAKLLAKNKAKKLKEIKEKRVLEAILNSAGLETIINPSPIVDNYEAEREAWLETKAEMDEIKEKAEELNAKLRLEFADKLSLQMFDSISSGMGSLMDFFSNKYNNNNNNTKSNFSYSYLITNPAGKTTEYASYAPGTTVVPKNIRERYALEKS